MNKPKVFLTRKLPDEVMERLMEETELEVNPEDRVLSKEEIINGIKGKDALLCLLTDKIDEEVLSSNPRLKIVANYAVGYNNIDVQSASSLGIPVSNTPGVLTDTSADLAFTLLMAVSRRIVEADAYLRSGEWGGWGPLQYLGPDIHGAVLGIVGLGRIGKAVAKRAKGFGMTIKYWNRTRLSDEEELREEMEYLPLDELLKFADYVSLHVAFAPETTHLISDREFRLMKPTSVLINTSRGAVVDEKALVRALKDGKIWGAGLDVFENEPSIEEELLTMKNVVLLPHLGSASFATRTKMGMMALENILAAWKGDKIPNLVNKELASGE
ncbi:MAG TPA: D-glycerate dehydrogenase [Cyclobacteriaceae bacterium]|nr:D-glycerate dehydrogenase [Cyclobacteriaceae bacterium]